MDNKTMNDGRDASKVDKNDASEVEYLHSQYSHLTHQQVKDAVENHGPVRTNITKYLDGLK